MGALSLVATVTSDRPRYERIIDFALAFVILAVGCAPAEYRRRVKALALSLMTVLLALAGVVAALSIDEAMTLVAGGVTAGLIACLFRAPPRRPRHAADGASGLLEYSRVS
jgi:hypothetical protein